MYAMICKMLKRFDPSKFVIIWINISHDMCCAYIEFDCEERIELDKRIYFRIVSFWTASRNRIQIFEEVAGKLQKIIQES